MSRAGEKARFYHELSRYLHAGFGIREALETCGEEQDLPGGWRKVASHLLNRLEQGHSLGDSFRECPGQTFTSLELTAVEAGERGGSLEGIFEYLGEYFDRIDQARRKVVRALIYPVFLIHLGTVALWTPSIFLFGAGWSGYFERVVVTLLLIYTFALALFFLGRGLWRAGTSSCLVDSLLRLIPLVGRMRKSGALARFCGSWQLQIRAGLPLIESLQTASPTSGSALLSRGVEQVIPRLKNGEPLGSALTSASILPPLVLRSLKTGEKTGELDLELDKCARYYDAESQASLTAVAVWFPRMVYLAVAIGLAIMIIQTYLRMFEGYRQLIDF